MIHARALVPPATQVLPPLNPRSPDFLLAWALETELATARAMDAEDWAAAARLAPSGVRVLVDDYADPDRVDHPGGPVPAW